MYVLEPEESAEDGVVDDYCADFDEEYEGG